MSSKWEEKPSEMRPWCPLHTISYVSYFPSSSIGIRSGSLRRPRWQKPLLLQPVSSSNTRTREGSCFLRCVLQQPLVFLPSAVTGHRQPQTPGNLSLWWPFWLPVSEGSLYTATTHAFCNSHVTLELQCVWTDTSVPTFHRPTVIVGSGRMSVYILPALHP